MNCHISSIIYYNGRMNMSTYLPCPTIRVARCFITHNNAYVTTKYVYVSCLNMSWNSSGICTYVYGSYLMKINEFYHLYLFSSSK